MTFWGGNFWVLKKYRATSEGENRILQEMIQFDGCMIFLNGLVQPPTRDFFPMLRQLSDVPFHSSTLFQPGVPYVSDSRCSCWHCPGSLRGFRLNQRINQRLNAIIPLGVRPDVPGPGSDRINGDRINGLFHRSL